MINGKRVIAIIPARAGSKSIPDKNIKGLAGHPLISWPIKSALNNKYIDRVIVSTDGIKIAHIAKEYGAETYDRPKELAEDSSLVIDCLRDLIIRLRSEGETAKYMVVLEATSPLRSQEDINKCIEQVLHNDSCATFCEAELNPHRAWKIDNGVASTFIDGAIPWLPRQELPQAMQLNGGVYVFEIDKLPADGVAIYFGKKGAVIMPHERSIDIDNPIHLDIAEKLLKESL